jgi:glutaredoxin-related protein
VEMGPDLQALLGRLTGRRTVPNILVNGKSIGGGDDIEQLHMAGKLASKIKDILGTGIEIVAAKTDI